jgi:hypothetical protein
MLVVMRLAMLLVLLLAMLLAMLLVMPELPPVQVSTSFILRPVRILYI